MNRRPASNSVYISSAEKKSLRLPPPTNYDIQSSKLPSGPDTEASGQTLGLKSASNLHDLGDKIPVIVYISKLITIKIINKRLELSGVKYKCEF